MPRLLRRAVARRCICSYGRLVCGVGPDARPCCPLRTGLPESLSHEPVHASRWRAHARARAGAGRCDTTRRARTGERPHASDSDGGEVHPRLVARVARPAGTVPTQRCPPPVAGPCRISIRSAPNRFAIGPTRANPLGRKTKRTQEPHESWRIRDHGMRNEPITRATGTRPKRLPVARHRKELLDGSDL